MGNVMAKIRVMPDSADRDLKQLESALQSSVPAGTEIKGFELKPIAFGLKAIIGTVVVNDEAGGTEAVEESWSKVEGVESVTVEDVGRLL